MRGQVVGAAKMIARALLIWAIEALSLLILAWLLPGTHLVSLRAAVATAFVLGLLNASLRPLVLLGAVNLGIIPFTIIAFLLNAVVVLLADRWLPGFSVDDFGSALVLAFGLALLNGIFTGLLSLNDQDTFYRNVTRRLARRGIPPEDRERPGTVIVQIDGLAEPVLRSEIEAGRVPTLARWVQQGTHRLVGWECAVPSMTSAVQSGIFYGNTANIPAFRWFDKETGKLFVSNNPPDAHALEGRQATPDGLLRDGGASISNLLTGGADHSVLTMAGLVTDEGQRQVRARDFYSYLANPYNMLRGVLGLIGEVAREYWEAWRQRSRHTQPHMHRGGAFPFLRAATTVVMRDASLWMAIDAMYQGRRTIYFDYLGYDEIAHHAGHASEDARGDLRRFDHHLASLEDAARRAPRPYWLVVLSDHGQTTGATFKQRYGFSLSDLVQRLISEGAPTSAPDSAAAQRDGHSPPTVQQAGGDEGWGHLNALLTEIVRTEGVTGRGAQRLLGGRAETAADGDAYVALGPEARDRERIGDAGVVVGPSGNLANVYFTREPGRLSLEYMVATYPGLIEGLVAHEGIGFILVYSEARGHVAMGARGVRQLDTGDVVGEDPLAPFSPHLAAQLRRISGYPNVGDILVNSFYNPSTGEVAAFEELIGCHGGAGGQQQEPFLLFPAAWTDETPALVGAENIHAFLSRFLHPAPAAEEPATKSVPVAPQQVAAVPEQLVSSNPPVLTAEDAEGHAKAQERTA